MRIHIIGSGATGGYFGGRLAKAGKDVVFLARGAHYEAMKQSGLEVLSAKGDFTVPKPNVISSIEEIREPDLILIFVKTYDTKEVAQQLSKVVSPHTRIISFQTGLENDLEIKKHCDLETIYPGFIYINSQFKTPGKIEQVSGLCTLTYGARNTVKDEVLNEAEKIFRSAEIDAKLVDNIEYQMWEKLAWISVFSGGTVLFRQQIGRVLNNTTGERIFRNCLEEILNIAEAKGVNFTKETNEFFLSMIDYYKDEGRNAKTSLLLDIEANKKTEADTLQGTLVRYAKELNLNVPLLELIYTMCSIHNEKAMSNVK